MTVYVRWYGKVLEGELLDGDYLGMKQVRIPLDGHYPVALFTPAHVYQAANHPDLLEFKPRSVKNDVFEVKVSTPSDIMPGYDRLGIEAFKEAYWDHKRNHLRIDKFDEFYQLWRMSLTPLGYAEAEAQPGRKEQKVSRQCEECDCWEFTTTLGSPKQSVWHCKHGFLPSKDCKEMAAYNEDCMLKSPNQRPADYKPVSKKPTMKMRCWSCEYLDYDIIDCQLERCSPGKHFCGLHGRARVDPDGNQVNLNNRGSCGYFPRKKSLQLLLFD